MLEPPMPPRILVFAGSTRAGADARLAARAVKELMLMDAEITWISLADYPLPLYEGNLEANEGLPENALKLKRLMDVHHGVFIASLEHTASVPPLLKNVLDWIARVRERNEPPFAAFRGRVFALGAASDRQDGAVYALLALRQVLEIGCGALVLPEQIAVGRANEAFDELGNLKDERLANLLQEVAQRLIDVAQGLAPP